VTDGRAELPRVAGAAVLVPVKAFAAAKERLAPLLDGPARARLARNMAARVVAAAAPLPVAVVCDDPEVAAWAAAQGTMVLPEPGRGLDGAVEAGRARLEDAGAAEVLVVHADLPRATGLARLAGYDGITLVPDRRDDGTNVIGLPAGAPFRFAYGAGSFERHRLEAERSGLPWRLVREPELEWDVDVPEDLPDELLGLAGEAAVVPRPPAG
jgi:2-phospho-L-lactate/phosphoenolpyruvate guanylyltransferase